jgi:PGF-CTERM protein
MNPDRPLAALIAVAVACSVLAPAAFASDASANENEIDDCTVIDEPGHYELGSDIQQDEPDSCILIRSGDVVLDGNGHAIDGPGAEDSEETIAGVVVDDGAEDAPYENITVRNVVIDNWDTGVQVGASGFGGSDLTLEDADVRNSRDGISHYGSSLTLANVTVEDNERYGLDVMMAGVDGTDVTLRENEVGFDGDEAGLTLESSRVVGHDDTGIDLQAHSEATLTDVLIAGNGGPGLRAITSGSQAAVYDSTIRDNGDNGVSGLEGEGIHLENTEVVGNDGDGLHVRWTDLTARNVTASGNQGLEVNALEGSGSIDAEGLHFGNYATATFEESDIALDPVDREDLPPREGGTPANDGLNVSGTVEESVHLELVADSVDGTVDLWRHDGDAWETVEEDLDDSNGSVETTVERSGLYAPGNDDQEDDSGQQGTGTIDSCTVIDEPGEYELVEDIRSDEADACIEVQVANVTLDGNGHAIEGPGAELENGTGIYVTNKSRPKIQLVNVVVAEWETGIEVDDGNYAMADSVVRNNFVGMYHEEGGADLTNVTIENNDRMAIAARNGGASGTDVTIRENGGGISAYEGGYTFESTRIVDNEGTGASVDHSGTVTLTNSTVSGNGGEGIAGTAFGDFRVKMTVENTEVTDNGGDGIHVWGGWTEVLLAGVTVKDNDGLEVYASGEREDNDFEGNVTAESLDVGPSATTTFENEAIDLEPVDREDLPSRDEGTAVGDGLNVSGDVDGPIDLELDVETDHDTVDLWRHDGDAWETVAEDLAVSDGTIEATVEGNSIYAPGTDDTEDGEQDGSEDEEQDGSDGSEDETDETDEGDTGEEETDETEDRASDKDGEKSAATPSPTPTDKDGEKDHGGDSDASSDSSESSNESDAGDSSGSSSSTDDTDSPTPTPSPTAADEHTEVSESEKHAQDDPGETDGVDGDDGEAAAAAGEEGDDGDDEGPSLGEGPGFTGVAALVAVLGSALLLRRRE